MLNLKKNENAFADSNDEDDFYVSYNCFPEETVDSFNVEVLTSIKPKIQSYR